MMQKMEARISKLEQGVTNGRLTLQELTLFDPRTGRKVLLTCGRPAYTTPSGNTYPAVGLDGSLVIYNLYSGASPTVISVP